MPLEIFTSKLRALIVFAIACNIVISYPLTAVKNTFSASNYFRIAVKPDVVDMHPVEPLPDLSSISNSDFHDEEGSGLLSEEDLNLAEHDNSFDPYSDMLRMEASVDEKGLSTALASEWSISESDSKLATTKMSKPRKKLQWEHWDEFMESEFGDMDRELKGDEKWIFELRDAVELKRGMAIWSKRSDDELKKEMKKIQSEKALKVPESIATVIRCVFLERTHTMKEMRKQNELAVIEFRKWMIEQRKKTKKDPLPGTKMDVSRRWLMQHPNKFDGGKPGDMPSVVMDEKRPTDTVPALISFGRKDVSPSPASPSGSKSFSSSGIVTSSMVNWEKSAAEDEANQVKDKASTNQKGNSNANKFFIDGQELFFAADVESEYFVLM